MYDNKNSATNWREQTLYGSSRLGTWLPNTRIGQDSSITQWDTVGYKQYELNNHLGNVMVTVTDKRLQHSTNGTTVDYYQADVATAQEYYSFGALMPARTYTFNSTKNYRYGFNGKENDNEVKGVGNEQDYGMRIYDNRVGRFLSVDPMANKLAGWSPYVGMGDNPILLFDQYGEYPYPIHIRSFAPYKQFGGYFDGDNRTFSAALGKLEVGGSVTSRVQQKFTVDPSQGIFKDVRTWSDPSHHPWFGTKTGRPRGGITDFKASHDKEGNNTVSFTSTYAGNLPLVPGSSDIDVHTKITLVENIKAGTLKINVSQNGDQFPAAETLIGDTKGNQLIIGVSPAVGFDDMQALGPFYKLPGDNHLPMMSNSFTVLLDKKGLFIGVKQGNKTYSVAEWNKIMTKTPNTKEQEKPLPVH